ncbi:hypothetical protein SFUMM280S_09641 [Streptomyces fumanus]
MRAVRAAVADAGLDVEVEDTADGPYLVGLPYDREIPVVDLRAAPDPEAAARRWMDAERARPAGLLAQAVLRTADDRWLWYLRHHRLLVDRQARPLLERRAAEHYTALCAGVTCGPSPFASPEELLAEEETYRVSADFVRNREYWTARFADHPEPVSLAPYAADPDDGRPAPVGEAVERRLRKLAESVGADPYHVIVAAAAAYLARGAGVRDVVFGVRLPGRPGRWPNGPRAPRPTPCRSASPSTPARRSRTSRRCCRRSCGRPPAISATAARTSTATWAGPRATGRTSAPSWTSSSPTGNWTSRGSPPAPATWRPAPPTG